MYDYSYGEMADSTGIIGGLMAVGGIIMLISSVVGIIMIISLWKIFKKAGKKGWESIVPIYNFVVLLQIVELPIWYIVLFFVPIANIYAMFKIYIGLAHKFGQSTGFGVATVFFSFVCLPILAFGKNIEYNGGKNSNIQPNNQYNPSVAPQNNLNNINNNEKNLNEPFTFDQNINTQINPMPTPVQEEPIVSPIPNVNPQPEINDVPAIASQQTNNQTSQVPTMPQTNSFVYNAQPTAETPQAQQSIITQTAPVEPIINTNPIQEPDVNLQPEINSAPAIEFQPESNQPTSFVYNAQTTMDIPKDPQPIVTPYVPRAPIMNPVQQPDVNPQPEINSAPAIEFQPENNQATSFVYNAEPTTEAPQVQQPIITPTAPVEPIMNTSPIQQPVADSQPVTPEPQVNVIPGMGPTPQPILTPENPGNGSNNTTM